MDNPYLQAGTDARKAAYLVALSHHGLYIQAAEDIGIAPGTASNWRKQDALFVEACRGAIEHSAERFEREAIRRGVEGVDEPIVHQGRFSYLYEPVTTEAGEPVLGEDGNPLMQIVRDPHTGAPRLATVKKYSDPLLAKVLEANSKKYARLSKVELSGPDGKPIQTEDMDPIAAARKIAFALTLGLRAKQQAEASGEDMV